MITLAWRTQERQAGKQRNQSRNQSPSLSITKVWGRGGRGGLDRMDLQLVSYPLMHCYLKVYKIFFYLFDMTLFNAYVLYNKITSKKLKHNQFRLVVAEELLDGLIMLEYDIQGHPAADTSIRLQVAHWAHFHSIYLQIV
jgi:hypothetical protein